MPIPFIAMAGASLLGSGISAFGAARQNRNNLRAQERRQRELDGAASQNQTQISQLFGGLQNTLGGLGPVQGQQSQFNMSSFDPLQAAQASVQGVDAITTETPDQIAGQSLDMDALFGTDAFSGMLGPRFNAQTGGSSFTPSGQTFNAGQDALLQFLRADPSGRMQGSNNVLQEIAATGLPADLSSIFAQATNVNRDNNAELLAMATGTGAGLGQRFGSATQRIAGDTARRLGNEQSLQNSQLALQAGEAAAGRRLGAASQLGRFQLDSTGQLIDAASTLQQGGIQQQELAQQDRQFGAQDTQFFAELGQADRQFEFETGQQDRQFVQGQQQQFTQERGRQRLQAAMANQQNTFNTDSFNATLGQQGRQFNTTAMNNARQFNADAANQTGRFNASAMNTAAQNNIAFGLQADQNNNHFGLQATRQNNDQQLNERQALLTQLGISGQLASQQSNALNQILGIRAGQGAPQATGQNMAQGVGGGFQDLSSMMQYFNRFGGGNQVPRMPNVNIPGVNIGPVAGANLNFDPFRGGR